MANDGNYAEELASLLSNLKGKEDEEIEKEMDGFLSRRPRIYLPNFSSRCCPAPLLESVIAASIASQALKGMGMDLAAQGAGGLTAGLMSLYVSAMAYDFIIKRRIQHIPLQSFGKRNKDLPQMSLEERMKEATILSEKVNDEYVSPSSFKDMITNSHNAVTTYNLLHTGQLIYTSPRVRRFGISSIVTPMASATTDPLGGEVYYLKKHKGLLTPGILAHEFFHKLGYLKELDAQVHMYRALKHFGDDELQQSAHCHRLIGHLVEIKQRKEPWRNVFQQFSLRKEIRADFEEEAKKSRYERIVAPIATPLVKLGMLLRGSSVDDYHRTWTNYLYATKEPI